MRSKLEKVNREQAQMIHDLEKEKAELEQSRADLEAILASLGVEPCSGEVAVGAASRGSAATISCDIWGPAS
jgi:hypothetical protein